VFRAQPNGHCTVTTINSFPSCSTHSSKLWYSRRALGAAFHPVDVANETQSFDSLDSLDSSVTIAGRYGLEVRIGRGAAGSVYRAHDSKLDRRVAIKLLQPGEASIGEREAQVLARISHRNVVTIHDFGHDFGDADANGHRYLVLELLEGQNFQEWLRERPLVDEVIARFMEAGQGLAAAHRAGFVHRDIKPSNLILTNEGRVVVIDFGLAQTIQGLAGVPGLPGLPAMSSTVGLSPNQFTEGTLAYMAPERLAGHDSDERSDQFSFCVALWEGLAGSNPFAGADPLARYRSIRNGPAGRIPGVARHIIQALERGLSFDREQRFSTMLELLRELERPAPAQKRKHVRPVLTSIALATTFLVGWGFTPENATIEEAHSSLDPRADVAISMIESARKRAAAGDARAALNDLMNARQLIASIGRKDGDYCTFGAAIPEVADRLVETGALGEAEMAYAIALRFTKDCPTLAKQELLARKESVRAQAMLTAP
jgi:predicted Ser/Thr protein kinase